MPIRAYCTICSDFFDHSRDVSAIHCGHTFHYHCLIQWFHSSCNRTCPSCRTQVSSKHIINKLFFDVGEEDASSLDPEFLQNEVERLKALLSSKEREWRDQLKAVDSLKDKLERHTRELTKVRKENKDQETLCSALKKQLTYLGNKQNEIKAAKDEARILRDRLKTYESVQRLLEGQREEAVAMVTDMGVGPKAVEQLSIYCVSLKKEYDILKGSHKSSHDMCDKLKREVFSSESKFQKATVELMKAKEEMKDLQTDLARAEREIAKLKKTVEILQETLTCPSKTNEAIRRLVSESPAPVGLRQLVDGEDIDLNMTYDIATPDNKTHRQTASKKMRHESTMLPSSKLTERSSSNSDEVPNKDDHMDIIYRNSLLFRKRPFGSMLSSQKTQGGMMRFGFDGLGGRTRCLQPTDMSEIRPLVLKAKRKKVPPPPRQCTGSLDRYLDKVPPKEPKGEGF